MLNASAYRQGLQPVSVPLGLGSESATYRSFQPLEGVISLMQEKKKRESSLYKLLGSTGVSGMEEGVK